MWQVQLKKGSSSGSPLIVIAVKYQRMLHKSATARKRIGIQKDFGSIKIQKQTVTHDSPQL